MLVSLLILTPGQVLGIDTIEITAAHVQQDEHEISDIKTSIDLTSDQQIALDMNFNLLQRPLHVTGSLQDKRWRLATTIDTTAGSLLHDARQLIADIPEWQITGNLELSVNVQGHVDQSERIQVNYRVKGTGLTGDLPETGIAFEEVKLGASGKAIIRGARISGQTSLQYQSGLFAYGDLLIEPLAGPFDIGAEYSLTDRKFTVKQFRLNDPGGLQIDIPEAGFDRNNPANLHSISASIRADRHKHAYRAWAQPLLYATPLSDLEAEGSLTTAVVIKNGKIQHVELDVNNASLADRKERFSLYGLSVQLKADDQFAEGMIMLDWQNAELYQLLLGKTGMNFRIDDQQVSIKEPFNIPVYNGELKVFQLSIDQLDKDHPTVKFDGTLTPVNLAALSDAMGWPPLAGSISGVIPSVRYDSTGLKVDGVLLARAFDGTFKINHLEMSDLFGPVPRLSADFALDDLDLEQLTRTFDFGRMEGKLSGYIAGLRMAAWEAQAFAAFFFTPEDDDGPHIICQKAVDNITSLSGSDIGSVLSRSYLSIFENFRYERLGIGCRLRNNVCLMNGIEAASGNSYYIVKGGFLPPRLDIIGYSHEVDWPDLLSRLDRVMSDNSPVIQ